MFLEKDRIVSLINASGITIFLYGEKSKLQSSPHTININLKWIRGPNPTAKIIKLSKDRKNLRD